MKIFSLILLLIYSCSEAETQAKPDPKVSKIMQKLSKDSLLKHVKLLASFDRLAIDEGNKDAENYIIHFLSDLAYKPEIQPFPFSYKEKSYVGLNIIIEHKGTSDEAPIILGAHYDSRNTPMSKKYSPGASDNASGTAILLEMARLLKQTRVKQDIRLVFFDSEEQGLNGSKFYADSIKTAGQKLDFMFNIDMVGGFKGMAHNKIVCEEDRNGKNAPDEISQNLNNKLLNAFKTYTSLEAVKGKAYSTDYMDFERNGYTILGLFEYKADELSPHYHKSTDTFENIQPDYFYEVAKAAMAFIFSEVELK